MIIENKLIYFNRTVSKSSSQQVALCHYNRVIINCNKVSIHELPDCFNTDLEITFHRIWSIMQKYRNFEIEQC